MAENLEIIKLSTPFIKLDQLLKYAGIVFTGADAKRLIAGGMVKVNGQEELRRGRKVFPGDEISVDIDGSAVVLKLE